MNGQRTPRTVIDTISRLRRRGLSNGEMVRQLQREGIRNPKGERLTVQRVGAIVRTVSRLGLASVAALILSGCHNPIAPSGGARPVDTGRTIQTIGGGSVTVESFVPIACPTDDCFVDETGTRWRQEPDGTWDAYCEECGPI